VPTISLHMRLIALAGLLLAAALVAATQLLLRDDVVADEPAPVAAPREASASNVPAAPNATAGAKTGPKAEASAKTEPVTKANAPAKTNTETANERALPTDKLPQLLADALRRHDVVVAAIFTPKAAVDRLARAEAEAGAKAAGAGFVALNLLQKKNGEPLATELGALKAPSVLVYKRPAKVSVHLYGFADMATVAQAAANARRG
jgi:hypothetical protein